MKEPKLSNVVDLVPEFERIEREREWFYENESREQLRKIYDEIEQEDLDKELLRREEDYLIFPWFVRKALGLVVILTVIGFLILWLIGKLQ